MSDYKLAGAGDTFSDRVERALAALERIRTSAPPLGDEIQQKLAHAAELVTALETLTHVVRERRDSLEFDTADALLARVTLEIYDDALRELRHTSRHSRRLIERSEKVLIDVRKSAQKRARRGRQMARKREEGAEA